MLVQFITVFIILIARDLGVDIQGATIFAIFLGIGMQRVATVGDYKPSVTSYSRRWIHSPFMQMILFFPVYLPLLLLLRQAYGEVAFSNLVEYAYNNVLGILAMSLFIVSIAILLTIKGKKRFLGIILLMLSLIIEFSSIVSFIYLLLSHMKWFVVGVLVGFTFDFLTFESELFFPLTKQKFGLNLKAISSWFIVISSLVTIVIWVGILKIISLVEMMSSV